MSDSRPPNCRFRLQAEGKAYPRSSCSACGASIATGLRSHCHHEISLAPNNLATPEALADADGMAMMQALRAERDEWKRLAVAGNLIALEMRTVEGDRDRLAAENETLETKVAAARKAAQDYCWQRYKGREPMNLSSPAVFTSHEWQKIGEAIDAALAQAAKEGRG